MPKIIYYNGHNKHLAQKLRREMTSQEKHLWYNFLRSCPVTFRRQKQIGPYIVDFYCSSANLVVEIDGSQHYEPKMTKKDAERTEFLKKQGLTVVRFSNFDIDRHFDGVCSEIDKILQSVK